MKKITLILFVLVCGFGFSQTFTDTTGPHDMQNGNGTTDATCGTADALTLPLAVTGVGTLGTGNSIESVTLNITHTWNADVNIQLQDPSGTVTVLLVENIGGSGDGFTNCVLQDGAPALPTSATTPVTGTFAPDEALAAFNVGTVVGDGTWNLLVCDDANGDVGTLDDWSITFGPTPTCAEPSGVTISNLGPSSTDFSWTGAPTATLGYEWGILAPGGDPEVDTFLFSGSTAAGVFADTVAGLTPSTDYVLYVRANCDTDGFSAWTTGTAFSTPALPPANDECDSAEALTVNADLNCGTVTAGTVNGATASAQPDDVTGTPDNDVWYTFVATSTEHRVSLLNVTAVVGTATDMGMGVYDGTGGCAGLVFFDDSDPNTLNLTGLSVGVTYYVRVYGWSGTNTAKTDFDICVGTPPPPPANDDCAGAIVINESADLNCGNAVSGTTVSATTSADYSCSTTYEEVWYEFTPSTSTTYLVNRTLTSGTATTYLNLWSGTCGALTQVNSSCTTTSLSEELTAGTTYYITVASSSPTVEFDLCVFPQPAPPANDECDAAEGLTVNADLACGVVTSGTTLGATASAQADDVTGTPDNDVWYSFVATNTAHQVSLLNVTAVAGTSTDMGMGVYDGTGGCAGLVFFDDSDPNTLTLTGLSVGVTYYVRVYGWSGTTSAQTTFDICVGTPPPPPANDECAGAEALTINAPPVAGTTISALGGSGTSCDGSIGDDVWYTVVGDGGDLTVNVNSTTPGEEAQIGIFESVDCAGITLGSCDFSVAGGGSNPVSVTFTSTPGTTYYIQVGHWINGDPGFDFDIDVTSTLSTEDFNFETGLTYYPNPVKDELTLESTRIIDDIKVYNLLGQRVMSITGDASTIHMDMSQMVSGVYLVEVTIDNQTKTIRLLKE